MRTLFMRIAAASLFVLALTGFQAFAGGQPEKAAPAGPVSFSYWVELHSSVAGKSTNLGDTPLYKELEKRTGVRIKFLHPPAGQVDEQFNLLIASRDLPDIVEWKWVEFPGGPEKPLKDGLIVPLNETIDKYSPNFKKLLDMDKDRAKLFKTDSGTLYGYPMIKSPEENGFTLVYHGPQFRREWLTELGLPVPSTIDEWYRTLKAFKEKKGASSPFTMRWKVDLIQSNVFAGAYGVGVDFYLEDGKTVKYGPVEPGFKAFLAEMRKWYAEGLLDPDFAVVDRKLIHAKVTSGKSGAFMGNAGGDMGVLYNLMKDDKNFHLVAAPYPTLNKGEKPKFGQKLFPYDTNSASAITVKNKNVAEAAKFLDYGYGQEGALLFNFGIAGQSYDLLNGQPRFTNLVKNNPAGLTMAQTLSQYSRIVYNGPYIEDIRAIKEYFPFPDQVASVKVWSDIEDFRRIPPITPSPEESKQYASIMSEVKTYVDEMTVKFIMGQIPLDKFDEYVATAKKMGIDQAVSIKRAALERFNKR